jgi:hypothetical protein
MYKLGDFVIYHMPKQSAHPGPRAKDIQPSVHGETYSYVVDKFWVVAEVRDDGKLLLKTRRGKEHLVDANDRLLRRAGWWDKLMYGRRFPKLPAEEA